MLGAALMPSRPPKHRTRAHHRPERTGTTDPRRIRSSGRWRKLAAWKIQHDPLCERCRRLTQCVHHIFSVAKHPALAFDADNLMSLCESCHVEIHGGQTVEMAIDDMCERR